MSRIMPVKIKWRQRTLREWETAICVCHLHNDHAKEGKEQRTLFWDHLAMLCAGGVRVCGMDGNMGLFGTIPEMERRGVEMRLCAVHGEICRLNMQWKWDSLGFWAVGKMQNPGTYICLSHHSMAGHNHPTLIDDAEINSGYKVESYSKCYPGPDPMQWQSEDPIAYARNVNAKGCDVPRRPATVCRCRAHRALGASRS